MTAIILNCQHCGESNEVKKLYITEPQFVEDKRIKGHFITECANPECKVGTVIEF
jgi:hypothetical protein